MFKLDEKHLEKAKEFAARNRKKKSCGNCYDRGYIGVTPENTLALCHKCVDMEKALEDWKNYVAEIPELKEQYQELFEDENDNQE
ncbi:MAG: hypothetical protein K9N09_04920 [Candidatus Cloacimonetes bacterium]|nr:hypothetical protein [Candidatus Cloacimonadota bacterium]MCF7813931.1 hypothetical protein [Candidatus Cloacimonadota bacterium]MCF7868025.1 hypothetical protein [Candidatus Cloacimonadota bacterium]MCF7884767.1 hypothetical protein [Candidatus Cloacimonadota bacterium]